MDTVIIDQAKRSAIKEELYKNYAKNPPTRPPLPSRPAPRKKEAAPPAETRPAMTTGILIDLNEDVKSIPATAPLANTPQPLNNLVDLLSLETPSTSNQSSVPVGGSGTGLSGSEQFWWQTPRPAPLVNSQNPLGVTHSPLQSSINQIANPPAVTPWTPLQPQRSSTTHSPQTLQSMKSSSPFGSQPNLMRGNAPLERAQSASHPSKLDPARFQAFENKQV